MFQALKADVRYALRVLRWNPAFTALAVASLAIGIGFNTAMFSAVDALLFRPLPIHRPDRIVDVYTRGTDGDTYATSSYPDFTDFRQRNQVFSDMIAYSPAIAAVKAGDRSVMALGEVVTGNYFSLLGVKASIGRTLLPEDDRPGAARAVAISHRLWVREYGSDPHVLGKTIQIHGQPYTIVGVISSDFTGMVPMLQPEMWLPIAWIEEVEPAGIQDAVPSPTGHTRVERRGQRWAFIKGRLKEGETAPRAEANLRVIMQQLAADHPQTNKDRMISAVPNVRIHPMADAALKPVAAGLMIGIGLVLLIACANVANMLLARASGRQRELGIRLAIGASRGRLIRQLLTESVVLGAFGAVAGVAVAAGLLQLIDMMPMPIPVPIALSLRLDARVLLFTTLVATAAGLTAGLAPALRATRVNLSADLKGDVARSKAAGRRWTLRDGLVALQTAVTLVLLVSAALLTRSLLEAHRVDLGFQTKGLVVLGTELSLIGYDEARAARIFDQVAEKVRALPGVASVGRAVRQPLAINYNRTQVFFPDRHSAGSQGTAIASTWVDEAYFSTLGVPLLRGRNFSNADTPTSPGAAVVNEAFARRYWPNEDVLGKQFRTRAIDGPSFEIVGVVGDYKVETVGEGPTPYIHYALRQRPSTGEVLLARTATKPDALLAAMRREVLALEPAAVFLDSQTMEAQVDATLLPARLAAQTIGLIGIVATALAAIGLYGVIAYTVSRRVREIGIRMALGATPGTVVGTIMRQGMSITAVGLAAGIALGLFAGRAIAAGLYGVHAGDPPAWAAAIGTLLAAAALANYIPARRAARVDPSTALRME
ncbi:MAG TPA: ABC transporter permease [Vicinamibacterales bacterium]|nr:ABC transporter permease [Vicinamibacterales bacterium]